METYSAGEYEIYAFTKLVCPIFVIYNGEEYKYGYFNIFHYGYDRTSAINNFVNIFLNEIQNMDTCSMKNIINMEASIISHVNRINESIEGWKTIGSYELDKYGEGGRCVVVQIAGMFPEGSEFCISSDGIRASIGIFQHDDYIGPEYTTAGLKKIRKIIHTLDDILAMMYREIESLEELLEWAASTLYTATLK